MVGEPKRNASRIPEGSDAAVELDDHLLLDRSLDLVALEANPNPALMSEDDLALSAKADGVAYPELLQRIVNLGINYRAAWDTESD